MKAQRQVTSVAVVTAKFLLGMNDVGTNDFSLGLGIL